MLRALTKLIGKELAQLVHEDLKRAVRKGVLSSLVEARALKQASPAEVGVFQEGGEWYAGPLYHGTSWDALPSILQEGLKPSGTPGLKAAGGAGAPAERPGVYLARMPSFAAMYADTAEELARGGASREPAKGVVLRVRKLPTKRLMSDEDFELFGNQVAKPYREGVGGYPHWSYSYRPDPILELRPMYERAFAPGDPPPDMWDLWRTSKRTSPGIGTVVYAGTIPPEDIEVLSIAHTDFTGAPVPSSRSPVAHEEDVLLDKLAELVRKHYERGGVEAIPWWLRAIAPVAVAPQISSAVFNEEGGV